MATLPIESAAGSPVEEIEMLVIGLLLQDPMSLYKMKDLAPDHFFVVTNGNIFSFLSEEIQAGREVTVLMAAVRFKDDEALSKVGAKPYLASCYTLASGIVAAGQYAEQVIEQYKQRKFLLTLEESISGLKTGSKTVEDVIQEMDKASQRDRRFLGRIQREQEVAEEVYNDLKEPSHCYGTGIACIDEGLAGGLYTERSYCIAARMKQGKTIMLSTISQNLRNVPHLFIAAEMGSKQIYQRDMARTMGTNSIEFLKNKSREFKVRVAEHAVASRGERWFITAPGVAFGDLKKLVLSAIKNKKIKGFILDYLQLVGGKERNRSEAEHQEEVAQWIANICRQEDIFALYAAQINREGNIRGSDGIVMAADQVYHLQRQETGKGAWMECIASRYTLQHDIGSSASPALELSSIGPHFKDYEQ